MKRSVKVFRTSVAGCQSALLLLFAGCHSAFVQATVTNETDKAISIFQVDYPNASFGGGDLARGGVFHYRFKILDNGSTKLTWTDQSGHDHTSKGPDLHPGQEGTLAITVTSTGANWDAHLSDGSR